MALVTFPRFASRRTRVCCAAKAPMAESTTVGSFDADIPGAFMMVNNVKGMSSIAFRGGTRATGYLEIQA